MEKKYGNTNFDFNGTYAYTVSEDDKTDKQLFYVPYHKLTGSVSYYWKKISSYYQYLYNGDVYTTPDNNPEVNVNDYNVSKYWN